MDKCSATYNDGFHIHHELYSAHSEVTIELCKFHQIQ